MKLEIIARKTYNKISDIPILCVHGGFHGAWCWDEYFLPFFANKGFDAYAVSLRGHGKSDGHKNINRWRIVDYVNDVESAIKEISTPPILIGHSLGGIVIQKYLEKNHTPGGVLLASSPIKGMAAASIKHSLNYPIPMLKMLFTFDMKYVLPSFLNFFFSSSMPKEDVEKYFMKMSNESFRSFMDIVVFNRPNPKLISTPMLVIGGEFDFSIPIEINRKLAKAYNTELETFPTAHDMMLERNWEMVAERIINWILNQ